MNWSFSLLLLVGVPPVESVSAKPTVDHFDNYTVAYQTAQKSERPMLVILNPGAKSEKQPITLTEVSQTNQRRDMLAKYVVVVIDTATEHGQVVHDLFKSPPLPRVVVIDREQKLQVFQSSDKLQNEQWSRILQTFENADSHTSLDLHAPTYCPT